MAVSDAGATVASQAGPSPEALGVSVSQGTYGVVVSGSGNATFIVTVSYPAP